jgi:hypothetical protein
VIWYSLEFRPVMSLYLVADQSQRKSAWTGIADRLLWQFDFAKDY